MTPINICDPGDDNLTELINILEVRGANAKEFRVQMRALAVDLKNVASEGPLAARARRKLEAIQLEVVGKALACVTRALGYSGKRSDVQQARMKAAGKALEAPLATLLSTFAFEKMTGEFIDCGFDERDLQTRAAQIREGPYRELEREMASRRRAIARHAAPALLGGTMEILHRETSAALQLLRAVDRGGPAVDTVRREAVLRLALIFKDTTGSPPTTTKGGAFAQFVEHAFDALGLPTQGIDTRIVRVLDRRHNQSRKIRGS